MGPQTSADIDLGPADPWMTLAEIAEYSRHSVRVVADAVADETLRTVKPRGKRLARRSWVDAWLEGTSAATTAGGPAA